jgi:PAS domain S-box-containing protein
MEKFSPRMKKLGKNEEQQATDDALSPAQLAKEACSRRYRELFEFAPEGYLFTDGEGVILEANEAAAKLLNVKRDRLVGTSLLSFVPEQEKSRFRAHLCHLTSSEVGDWEICLISSGGNSFPANITVAPSCNLEGTVVSLRWLMKDITARRQYEAHMESECEQLQQQVSQLEQETSAQRCTEAALRQQIAQLQAELQGQNQNRALVGSKLDLRRNYGTRKAQLQQALKSEAMLKRITDKVRDSLDESHILQTAVQELVLVLQLRGCNAALYDAEREMATISYEYTADVPAAQGQQVPMNALATEYRQLLQRQHFQFCSRTSQARGKVAVLACPIVDNQQALGDLWLFKHKDESFSDLEISLVQQVATQCAIAIRQARLYQEVQSQVSELERLNRLKDEFLSTISHELRTPVSNMKMAIQMIALTLNREQPFLAELAKPHESQTRLARYFQILQNECEREINLINDVLDLQRLEGGTQPLKLAAVHLQDWLPRLVAPYREKAQKHQQNLQLYISPKIPPFFGDQSSLERILIELLNNACKYTPQQEQIYLTVRDKPGLVQIAVTNTGVEIPDSELARIFEKFYRIPSTDPWKQGGTGLGLALIKKLVAHLGGILEVDSKNNATCFSVTLPLNLGEN